MDRLISAARPNYPALPLVMLIGKRSEIMGVLSIQLLPGISLTPSPHKKQYPQTWGVRTDCEAANTVIQWQRCGQPPDAHLGAADLGTKQKCGTIAGPSTKGAPLSEPRPRFPLLGLDRL